jgi:hypothetical protein
VTAPAGAAQPWALTRFVVLRLLGVVYLAAFWGFVRQGLPLLGHHGLLPVDQFLTGVAQALGSRGAGFSRLPSLFWLDDSDAALLAVGWAGAVLAAAVVAGFANAPMMLALWALYMSVVHTGQLFYGYGWETQLLETGFLAVFLAPPLDPRPFPARGPPRVVVWLFWWLIARVMLGAGLIKLRGDPCWRDLTCLDFHYQTQPIPNPLSPAFHVLPHPVHAAGVLFNHLVELGCPFLLVAGRRARHVAAGLMLAFQGALILSGNLSFLNHLTLVPILACFDDGLLARVLPRRLVAMASRTAAPPGRIQSGVAWALALLVAVLSVEPVQNLLSPNQRMNTSFDALDLVNTYGAFGSVGRERDEIILEGTRSDAPDANAAWRPYEFPCKPGDPMRRPCVVSPYQPRLDWQIWFAAMSEPAREPWLLHLVWKLLHNDAGALSLLAGNPFPEGPPRYIRARFYRYTFAGRGELGWWTRQPLGLWLPPLSTDDPRLQAALEAEGWSDELAGEPGKK